MGLLKVRALEEGLPFGARISGVTREALNDQGVCQQLRETFAGRGMIVFEDIEPSPEMQVLVSKVFGPLKEHPVKIVERVDADTMPGVITIRTGPHGAIVEIDGKQLATWQPWHFDHSYNNELNYAGVLRAETIAPEGGLTAFADGIQIYKDMTPSLREKAEQLNVVYTLDLHYARQWFGLPESFREIRAKDDAILAIANSLPRAIHPAVWTRETGEKVAHLSPYGARGLEGMETPEGNALLRQIWDDVEARMKPYYHQWKPGEMVIWDNLRMLHKACGCDPQYERIMHRTTIAGDYGLGRWETAPDKAVELSEY